MGEISLQNSVLAAVAVVAMIGVSGLIAAALVSVAMTLRKLRKDERE